MKLQLFSPPTGVSQETQRCQKTPEAVAEDLNNSYGKQVFRDVVAPIHILFKSCNLFFKLTASNAYSLCIIETCFRLNKCWFAPLEGGVMILSWSRLQCLFSFLTHVLQSTESQSPQSCFVKKTTFVLFMFARHIQDHFVCSALKIIQMFNEMIGNFFVVKGILASSFSGSIVH